MSTTRDPMASRVAFFYEHAGYSYDPARETAEQGRQRCAEKLARAEETAASRGWYVATMYDNDWSADPDDERETTRAIDAGELVRLIVLIHDEDGRMLAAQGSVIVPSEDDPYVRVVAAELASELLANHEACHARVTCGGCGHAWCEKCDPAPSALCHWCHGRGWSDAELEPIYEEGLRT